MWRSINFLFLRAVEIDLLLYAGRKSLDFRGIIELDLVFVWVVETSFISFLAIEVDLVAI